MMFRYTIPGVVLVMSLFVFADTQSEKIGEKKYDFTPDFKAGDELRFQITWDSRVSLFKRYLDERELSDRLGMEWLIQVQQRLPSNELHMTLTIVDVRYQARDGIKIARFDSKQDRKKKVADSPLGTFLLTWLDKPITFRVSDRGVVTDVQGVDIIRKEIKRKCERRGLPMYLGNLVVDPFIRTTLNEMFTAFPQKPVAIGDTWSATTEYNYTGGGVRTRRSKANYTLEAVNEESREPIFQIDLSEDYEFDIFRLSSLKDVERDSWGAALLWKGGLERRYSYYTLRAVVSEDFHGVESGVAMITWTMWKSIIHWEESACGALTVSDWATSDFWDIF